MPGLGPEQLAVAPASPEFIGGAPGVTSPQSASAPAGRCEPGVGSWCRVPGLHAAIILPRLDALMYRAPGRRVGATVRGRRGPGPRRFDNGGVRPMLLTITTTHRPATDLGFLLHKHPDRFQSYDLSFGKAHAYYPEATEGRCTACLLLDVDPVGIVRGKGSAEGLLSQYVNDRPYVASSFLSVAISQVYGSALQGRCKDRPELATDPDPALGPARCPAGAGRRDVPAGGVRAAGLRRRVRASPARRPLPRVGRGPVLLRDHRARPRRSRNS